MRSGRATASAAASTLLTGRYGVSQITISSLGSRSLCLVLCISSSAHDHLPPTAGKLRDETSYIAVFGVTSKNPASGMGSELRTEHGRRKRERGANSVFLLSVSHIDLLHLVFLR